MLRASVIFVDTLAGDLSMAARPLVSSGGSAVRRRQLATVTHHSFQVGTAYDALRSQKPVSSAGGMRPRPLVEGRPQVWIQRHTVEQRIEHTPYVHILDAPVPQKVEQLVELPAVLTPTRIAVQIPEQIVGIPVPRGGHGRLPVSLPGQGSTASAAEQIAYIPSSSGDLQGFRPRQSSTAVSEQNVSTPAPCRGGLRFRAPQWIFQFLLGTLMKGFFALFPGPKKVRRYVLAPGRNWPRTRAHPRRALMAW